jgi:hypothetical protein
VLKLFQDRRGEIKKNDGRGEFNHDILSELLLSVTIIPNGTII